MIKQYRLEWQTHLIDDTWMPSYQEGSYETLDDFRRRLQNYPQKHRNIRLFERGVGPWKEIEKP